MASVTCSRPVSGPFKRTGALHSDVVAQREELVHPKLGPILLPAGSKWLNSYGMLTLHWVLNVPQHGKLIHELKHGSSENDSERF